MESGMVSEKEMNSLIELMHDLSNAESSFSEAVESISACYSVLVEHRNDVELQHIRRLSKLEVKIDPHGAVDLMGALGDFIRDTATSADSEVHIRSAIEAAREAAKKMLAVSVRLDGAALAVIREHKENAAKAIDALDEMKARHYEHSISNPKVRQKVWALTSGHCIYCNIPLALEIDDHSDWERRFHVDHIVPKSHGGPDHISNYVPACASCNSEKRDLPVAEFITLKHMKQGKLVLMRVLPDGLPTEQDFVDAVRRFQKRGPGIVTDDPVDGTAPPREVAVGDDGA